MKFIAYKQLNMREVSFLSPDYYNILSASPSKIVVSDDNGNKREYFGKFEFLSNGDFRKNSFAIDGINQYDGKEISWSAESMNLKSEANPSHRKKYAQDDYRTRALTRSDIIIGSNKSDIINAGGFGGGIIYRGQMVYKDIVIGGGGSDLLNGGRGDSHRYVYNSVGDSKAGSKNRDQIAVWESGNEIDLSAIDANPKLSGNQKLKFIGKDRFTGKGGEVRFDPSTRIVSNGRQEVITLGVDVDGDKKPDMEIFITPHPYVSSFDKIYENRDLIL